MGKYFLVGACCLVAGFFIGFYVSNNINRNENLQTGAGQTNAPIFNQQTQVASVKEPAGAIISDVKTTIEKAQKEPDNFEAQMEAGNMYLKIGDFEKAAVFYDAAAALKPSDYEKNARLGNAFFDVRQFEKAENFYARALEAKPDDIDVRTDYGTAFLQRANPDYDRAIKELETALKQNPKHEAALFNIALAHHRKGDAEQARKYLVELEKANPNSQLVGRIKQVIE